VGRGSVGLGLATRHVSISNIHDRKNRKTSVFFLTVSAALLLSNVFAADLTNFVKSRIADKTVTLSAALAEPLSYMQKQAARVESLWDVQEQNEMLAAENERLLEWFQTANRLDAENKALRDLLKMKDEDALTFRSGKVLSDSATQYSHTILVQLGKNDGLNKGQGVLSHEGLIGRVIETGNQTSRVLLMSDVNSRIPVTIDGSSDRAILAGTNNNDPILDHLPESHSVKAGQKVITSGHGGIFPYGVPVGETYLNQDGQLAVRPFASPNRANYVQIVDYGIPAGSATRATASNAGVLR
tara:strand:- start:2123 stop:3019 length:897 start_codon:yes stop_codon:yes gene_type:complete